MPELIDKEASLKLCSDTHNPYHRIVREFLLTAPTVDAEPVRHGRWIAKLPYEDETVKDLEFQIVCSRCDEQNSSITFDENSVPIAKTFYRTRYCPNCGAKMDLTELPKGAE